jgi:apolipoprotein N-acyltransferase
VKPVVAGVVLPAAAGALCVFSFAPFYAWPVVILGLAFLFHGWAVAASPREALRSGYCFGLGYFLAGVSWVYVSLHVFGSMPAILAGLATLIFCAYLALWPAFAGWLTVRFARSPATRLAIAAATFAVCEWLRGWLFTGFPWLGVGTSQVPASPFAGFAPILGTYGVTLVAGMCAAALAMIAVPSASRRSRGVAAALVVLLAFKGWILKSVEWTEPAGAAVSVALLQGNIPQKLKWQEEVRTRTLLAYREMIFLAKARIVVIPETALPAFLDQLPEPYMESLREHARGEGKEILMGTVERDKRTDDADYYNSLVSVTGERTQAYRKRHLVPFGEYIPPGFKWILAILKIPLTDFLSGARHQPPVMAAGIPFGVAICYEDVFGEEVIDALPAAQALLNVSNDAWFGESLAADQHLQASQMRALETGRWMLRSTNTGVTAAIDEQGRVVSRLAAFTAGTLVAEVVPRRGTTPYVRAGNFAAITLAVALGALGFGLSRRQPRP